MYRANGSLPTLPCFSGDGFRRFLRGIATDQLIISAGGCDRVSLPRPFEPQENSSKPSGISRVEYLAGNVVEEEKETGGVRRPSK